MASPQTESVPKRRESKAKKPTLALLSDVAADALNDAAPTRTLCQSCGRFTPRVQTPYKPVGYTGKVLLVFDCPPTVEERQLVFTLAGDAGYGLKDLAFCFAVRCGSSEPTMKQIRCCRPFLLRTIQVTNPGTIFAMGPSAMRSITNSGKMMNITKLRGRPWLLMGVPVYATYSPSSILSGGTSYRVRILEDFRRPTQKQVERPAVAVPVIKPSGVVSLDTEYAPNGELLTVGLSNGITAIAVEPQDDNFYETVGALADAPESTTLIGHSVSGDIDQAVKLGIVRPCWVSGERIYDSLLIARMHDENRGPGGYGLETLLCSGNNVELWKNATEAYSKTDATQWPEELRRERCRLDAWAAAKIVNDLQPLVVRDGMPVGLTHQIAMALHRIRLAGVYIDLAKLNRLGIDLTMERDQAKSQLQQLAVQHGMTTFSPTNDDDIRTLLYKKMKLPVVRKTEKSKDPAVDKITLAQFADHNEVKLLLAFNKTDKAYSTNVLGVQKLVQPIDGYHKGHLPVNINPLGAKTGRRSSSEPNMQNWPPAMRQVVVSRFPGGTILELDYKSLEVFLLAFVAGDDKLYDYFANRGGYIAIAKEQWGADVTKGSPEYKSTKSVVLGTNYNMQTKKMARSLWDLGTRFSSDYKEHEKQTDKLRNSYLDMFPGLRRHMAQQRAELEAAGQVVSLTGRVRHLPLTDGEDTPGFFRKVNQAINFPIQSLASDVTGSALIDCEAVLCKMFNISLVEYHAALMNREWPNMPLIINEVHDSLVFDVPNLGPVHLACITEVLQETMEQVKTLREAFPNFTVKLKVDAKQGPHWGVE